MSHKFPFAVLVIHPNSGIEFIAVLADSHTQALKTAASICIERQQPHLSVVAAFSLTEINNVQKILARAEFVGEGNGLRPQIVEISERALDVEYGDFFEDDFGYDEHQTQPHFPTRKRDLYDVDEQGIPQPKGGMAAELKHLNTAAPKINAVQIADPSTLTSGRDANSLHGLDLSQGQKTNEGKSNVFLDDFYQD